MRRVLLTGVVLLASWGRVQGQDTTSRFLVGSPGTIRNQPIDVSKALRTTGNVNRSMNLGLAQGSNLRSFGFSNLFPKISLGTWPPPTPQVSVLPQKQNIFQPNPPKGGINLFDFKKDTKKK